VNDDGVMTIWDDTTNRTISEISDCGNMTDEERLKLTEEVLSDLGYIVV
jgi:hypothetical protein